MTDAQRVWMTPETRDRLKAELAELTEAGNAEHGGDEELADRQARHTRIHQIHELLTNAVVGEDPPDDGVAEPGMVLTVRYDDDDTETFLLGIRDDEGELEVYSTQSPLGKAISGARPGEQRSYQVPSGKTVSVMLVKAVPYGMHQTRDSA